MNAYRIVTFYKFVKLTNIKILQSILRSFCQEQGIFGTLLLAQEGINGTLAGQVESIQALLSFLRTLPGLSDLKGTYFQSATIPFRKTKILIKNEIVGLQIANIEPSLKTGIPVTPEAWNVLLSDPDIILIDTRNTYEIEWGTFKGAINPTTRKFKDFPLYVQKNLDPKKHKKIAMFCTGGIRCEKASSYLLAEGFETVYQLQGGILKYLEKMEAKNSLWQGKCFIFDERITVETTDLIPSLA